jgi:hypothetical protein
MQGQPLFDRYGPTYFDRLHTTRSRLSQNLFLERSSTNPFTCRVLSCSASHSQSHPSASSPPTTPSQPLHSDELPTKAALADLGKKLDRVAQKARKEQVQHTQADDRSFDKSSAGAMFDAGFMDAFGVEGTPGTAPEAVTKRTQFTTPARRPRARGGAAPATASPTDQAGTPPAGTTPAPASTSSRDYSSRAVRALPVSPALILPRFDACVEFHGWSALAFPPSPFPVH